MSKDALSKKYGEPEPEAPVGPAPRPELERALYITVVVLGALIVVGLFAVLGRIIYLSSQSGGQPADLSGGEQGRDGSTVPFGTHLALPEGAQVRSMSLSGTQLAVHYDAPDGGGILIIDLKSGRTVGRLRAAAAGHAR